MELMMKPSQKSFNAATKFIKVLDSTKTFIGANNSIVSKMAKDIKRIKAPVQRYFDNPGQIRSYYSEPEYDLSSVFKLLKYEAYFLKSVQKKQGLLTKSGLCLYSNNDEITSYIRKRFRYMQLQTGISLDTIIKKCAYYLIICSNAFIIKVREKESAFAKSYMYGGKERLPVVGLFLAHPTTMRPKYKYVKDPAFKTGTRIVLDKWVQINNRGVIKEFDPDDVAHFTLFKEDGMLYGMPECIPVIDDIRTLRKVEEDIQLLLYRDLFPIIHYSVEDPRVIDHASGYTELDKARSDMQNIVQDGGIATDKRHELKFVGNEGKSLDAQPYLSYFQQRVFSGLGVSAVDLGIGDTSNKSTAETLSGQLVDYAKYLQQEISAQFKDEILDEMMLQSSFEAIFDEDNEVHLQFEEIDIEWKIRQENHEADLYSKGVKTIHETRNKMGNRDISDDDLNNYTFHGIQNKFAIQEIKKQEEQSAAERDSLKASKTNSNTVKAKDMKLEDSIQFISIQDEFKNTVNSIKDNTKSGKKLNIMFATKAVYDIISDNMLLAMKDGAKDAASDIGIEDYKLEVTHNIFEPISKLRDNVVDMLCKDENLLDKAALRVATADRTERLRAYNYAYCKTAMANNKDTFIIYSDADTVSGDSFEFIGKEIKINDSNILEAIPPFRPNSRLKVKIVNKVADNIVNDDPTDSE